jgi:hypothetical protein
MKRVLVCLAVVATSAFGQYKAEPAGAPPALAELLQKEGIKVSGPNGATLEIWLRSALPPGGKVEESASVASPHGALLGVVRTAGPYVDRRGQTIKPGVYTLRYSIYPVDGNHQGVSPQRDFLIMGRIADDKAPNVNLGFDPLMDLSRKASGTPHPLALSFSKGGSGDGKLGKEGENDWVLNGKIGDTLVAIIVFGLFQG